MGLAKPGFFSLAELHATWAMLEELYSNHSEIIEGIGPIQVSIGKATIVAWRVNPLPSHVASTMVDGEHDPAFILRLRQLKQRSKATDRADCAHDEASGIYNMQSHTDSGAEGIATVETLLGDLDSAEAGFDKELSMNPVDWIFWNQILQPDSTCFT